RKSVRSWRLACVLATPRLACWRTAVQLPRCGIRAAIVSRSGGTSNQSSTTFAPDRFSSRCYKRIARGRPTGRCIAHTAAMLAPRLPALGGGGDGDMPKGNSDRKRSRQYPPYATYQTLNKATGEVIAYGERYGLHEAAVSFDGADQRAPDCVLIH